MDHQEKVNAFVEKYMCKDCYSVRIESKCNHCKVDLCKGVKCYKRGRADYHGYLCNNCWFIARHENDGC